MVGKRNRARTRILLPPGGIAALLREVSAADADLVSGLASRHSPIAASPSLPEPPATYVPDRMRRSGTTPLPVEAAHALRTAELPNHHDDPFDRLLIAQAQLLDIPILTIDNQLSAYTVTTIAA